MVRCQCLGFKGEYRGPNGTGFWGRLKCIVAISRSPGSGNYLSHCCKNEGFRFWGVGARASGTGGFQPQSIVDGLHFKVLGSGFKV